jgi:hypothetical protein
MITFLEAFKYLAAMIVALSVPGFGLVAFSFLAFCDHGPFLVCFLRMAVGIALAQVVMLLRAWTFLKQRRRFRLAAGLMILSIVPVPVAIVIFIRIPS